MVLEPPQDITKPSLEVASEAYQLLLELSRAHPEDPDLIVQTQQAYDLMDYLWTERYEPWRLQGAL